MMKQSEGKDEIGQKYQCVKDLSNSNSEDYTKQDRESSRHALEKSRLSERTNNSGSR